MRRRAVLTAGLGLGAAVPLGCTSRRPPAPERLTIAAGGSGEVHHVLAEALAGVARRSWSAEAAVLATGGSVENLRLLADGRADAAFSTVDLLAAATQGNYPFDRALPLVAVGRLYDDYLQVVTLAGSETVYQLGDLAGLPVGIGAREAGIDLVADRVLVAAGLGLGRIHGRWLDPAASAAALLAGEVEAFFVTGGLPTPAVAALAAERPIHLLSLSDHVDDLRQQYGELYLAQSIPANTYGIEAQVETLGIPNVLVVGRYLPDDTAYRLTELLFTAKPELVAAHGEARRLNQRSALATYPVPLHPGAEWYYRESKPMVGER